jgi:hypothetical protein
LKTKNMVAIALSLAALSLGISAGFLAAAHASASETEVVDSALRHVPAGYVLLENVEYVDSGETESIVIDSERRLGRLEEPAGSALGSNVTLFNDDGHTTLDCYRLRLFTGEANIDALVRRADLLEGIPAVHVGDAKVDGLAVDVLSANIADPEGRAEVSVEAYVDMSSGLRIREEWKSDGKSTTVITRRFVARSPDISACLESSSLDGTLATLEQARLSQLDKLPYQVFRIRDDCLVLEHVIPGSNWNSVRLEYAATDSPDRIVAVVSSWDMSKTASYPAELTAEKSSAVLEKSEAGSRLSWSEGETAVQLQVCPGAVEDLWRLAYELGS